MVWGLTSFRRSSRSARSSPYGGRARASTRSSASCSDWTPRCGSIATGLSSASHAVVRAVDAAIEAADRALLIACSGGADSLALAFGAWRVSRRRRLPVAAMVVDHGLQPHSAQIAEAACSQLARIGYADVTVERVSVGLDSGSGTEAAARDARYRALNARGAALDATILLGHTLDDQAETVLLGLARGSGARSLAGMPVRARGYLRPLLAIRRRTTEAACGELDLHPWSDPHNADRRRVLLRWLRAGGASDVTSTHLLRVESLITEWHGQGPVQLPALQVVRRAGELHIITDQSAVS